MKIGLHEDLAPVEKQDLETMCVKQQLTEQTMDCENSLHWMELAIDDPLFSVSYTKVFGTLLYSVDITQNPPSKEGVRNMDFEIVYPIHQALTDIIEDTKPTKTSWIKINVNSKDHFEVVYTDEFPADQWSYKRTDEIMEGLADQLTMKQNLNGGLLVQLTFSE